jgi:hypothetical protein
VADGGPEVRPGGGAALQQEDRGCPWARFATRWSLSSTPTSVTVVKAGTRAVGSPTCRTTPESSGGIPNQAAPRCAL